MKVLLLTALLSIQCLCAHTQIVLNGLVTDAEDHQPVQYASIGVTSKPNGTVSNAMGVFTLTLDSKVTDNDTLKFSSIGYRSEAFLIDELKERQKNGQLTILLKKSVSQLKQVSVVSKKASVKIAGYDVNSKLFGVGFNSGQVGSQAGVIISVKHPETNLENLSLFIIRNTFSHLIFRINLYEMVNDKPGNNILSHNILVHVDGKQRGKVTFDLTPYALYLDKDALITLEWIEADPTTGGDLAVGAKVFGHTYFRQASQYTWGKNNTGLGLSVKTNY